MTKTGKVYGSNIQVGDVWLRNESRIVITSRRDLRDGGILVNEAFRFSPIDRYRIERTYND
jgi:hypothetical protein